MNHVDGSIFFRVRVDFFPVSHVSHLRKKNWTKKRLVLWRITGVIVTPVLLRRRSMIAVASAVYNVHCRIPSNPGTETRGKAFVNLRVTREHIAESVDAAI